MKRIRCAVLALCLLLVVSACSASGQAEPEQAQEPLALARSYQSTIAELSRDGTVGVNLSQAELEQIVSALAAQGVTVSGVDGRTPMQNPQAVDAFFADRDAGKDARLTLYEVCLDGGLLCHALAFADGETTLTLTRIAWSATEPTVGYSREYAVTELTDSGGTLHYVYDMPDNPPGTNHDGHIDTEDTFQIG